MISAAAFLKYAKLPFVTTLLNFVRGVTCHGAVKSATCLK